MFIPTTYSGVLAALAITVICWALWPTVSRAGKWRFELSYFDFALGCVLTAVLLAVTAGNTVSSTTFTFEDNLTIAGKRQMGIAFGAGLVINLGNMLIAASASLSGISSGIMTAMIAMALFTAISALVLNAAANPALALAAIGLLVAALALAAYAHFRDAASWINKRALFPGYKSLLLGAIGGLIFGAASPIMEASRAGDVGLGSWTVCVMVSFGVLVSTFLYNLYFLNLPVSGSPLSMLSYFRGSRTQHLSGLAAGAIWTVGLAAMQAAEASGVSIGARVPVWAMAAGSGIIAGIAGILLPKDNPHRSAGKIFHFGATALLAIAIFLLFSAA